MTVISESEMTTFMESYNRFMELEDPFAEEHKDLLRVVQNFVAQFDDPRSFKNPSDPESTIYGYLAVRSTVIYRKDDGKNVDQIIQGDVVVMQYNWDRNVIVTHVPLSQNIPIPYVLIGVHVFGLEGLWLPIFDAAKIRPLVELQMKKYTGSIDSFLVEEEDWWRRNGRLP
jgi:hypothetical protein